MNLFLKPISTLFILFFVSWITVKAQCVCPFGNPGTNLVTNGDFSAGNIGFSSSYTYCNTSSCLGPAAYYAVGTDAAFYHPAFVGTDHTTGTGNFMIINGADIANVSVWCQTISVTANTDYLFSAWVSTLYPSAPAQLQLSVNGINIGAISTAAATVNIWTQFCISWNSGSNTTANICIINQNTASVGNDFGLDDIAFQSCTPCSIVADAGSDTSICAGGGVTLSASGGITYSWSPTTDLSNPNIFNPTATPSITRTYTVTASLGGGCSAVDSVTVTIIPLPSITVSADTMICQGTSINLTASGADSYSWSPITGLTNSTGSIVSSTSPSTITYSVTGTDTITGCSSIDSIHLIVKPLPVQPVNGNWVVCYGDTLSFNFSGWTMQWNSNQASLPTSIIATANEIYVITMVDTNSCYDPAFSITVTVNLLPYVNAGNDTMINSGDLLTLNGSGQGTILWTETGNTLSCNNCSNPMIAPLNSTTYYLTVMDTNGCSNRDSVYVEVNDQLELFIPNAFTPNQDEINDLFFAKGYGIKKIHMVIFNRWGEKIMETDSYGKGWDGTYKGEFAEQGVYIYSINAESVTGSKIKRIGHVTLIK